MLRSRIMHLMSRRSDLNSVQSMHTRETPRVGGIAVFGAIGLGAIFSSVSISSAYTDFVLFSSLLFFVGLAEDLGFKISPRNRLLAAASSSLLIIWVLGFWLPRTGFPILDTVIDHWAVGIPLTVLVTVGISNGFNLIDGVNGLASFTGIVAAFALSQIAEVSGYPTMAHLSILIGAGILGFFIVNYPFGLIFLGDAGAYTIGFVLSWIGIVILINIPDVSPWAILLTLFWPVADTLLAIYRRSRRGLNVCAPDRLHVHQIIMRGLEICFFGKNCRHITNPLTTLVMSPLIISPPIVGILLWDQNWNAFLAVLFFCLLLFAGYFYAPKLIWQFRRKSYRDSNTVAVITIRKLKKIL